MKAKLKCRNCESIFPLGLLYECSACGAALEVEFDYSELAPRLFQSNLNGIWDYKEFLPVWDDSNIVSLGEGGTPLLRVPSLCSKWKIDVDLYIKAESLNPTGSFKDRPTSVGVSAAKESGFNSILVASSGNAAASAAAYAARAGMPCYVIVPESTDGSKVQQALAYGAMLFSIPGTYSDAFKVAKKAAEKFNIANVTSTYINPYTVEGNKTIAYELFAQLNAVPDFILIPIGTGPLLTGVLKGFKELLHYGIIDRLPHMIGVQAAACNPIAQAYNEKRAVHSWQGSCNTIATGIADPLTGYVGDGDYTLKSVYESNGHMVSLSETIIEEQLYTIESTTGIYCEPAGSVSVSAVKTLYREGTIKPNALVVSLMTGSGFKFSYRKIPEPVKIKSFDELTKILNVSTTAYQI